MNFILFVSIIGLAYFVGTMVEVSHYQEIKTREQELLTLPVVTSEDFLDETKEVEIAELVSGSVVVSIDYFKRILAGLRNIVGGEVSSYETLIDRGRREAMLRMKELARGADIILNMRIETSSISQSANKKKQNIGSIEVLAYGTAVTFKK